MDEGNVLLRPVLVVEHHLDLGSLSKRLDANEVDVIRRLHSVVVGRVLEHEGKETLLLQVGLVDAGERASDDGVATEETGLERGVLSGRSLSEVLTTSELRRAWGGRRTSSPITTQGIPASRYAAATAGKPPNTPVLRFSTELARPLAELMAPM